MGEQSYITFRLFEQFEDLLCAVSTRKGGTSSGLFSSQNMGNFQQDKPQNIFSNRIRFYNRLNVPENAIVLPGQIHSSNCCIVNSAADAPDTDSLITTTPGLFLGVQTADCFPVFLYSPKSKAVAVVHAGWRGVVSGIIPKTLSKMSGDLDVNISVLYAVIGPGLQKECFEVQSDVYNKFPEKYIFPHIEHSKRYLDLSGFIRSQLIGQGLRDNNIYQSVDCTKCQAEYYYSYRRDGINSGRMLGIIGLKT